MRLRKGRPFRTRKDQWCPHWGGDEDGGQGGLEISMKESMSSAKGIKTKKSQVTLVSWNKQPEGGAGSPLLRWGRLGSGDPGVSSSCSF